MTKTRKCAYCGKVFILNSGMQKYCSEECATAAKETRKKKQRDFLRAVEPVMELQQQEYLTFSKAALLLGCTRQYVYKLVEQGKLPASRLSSRMALIRRSDIEKMFEANPYNRVLPCPKPKQSLVEKTKVSSKRESKSGKTAQTTDEVLKYYSGDEVMQTYKVKQSWLYTSAKRHQIPMCRIAGRNYYSKKHIDTVFDRQNNDFGWAHLPKSFMNQNTVFLLITAMAANFYRYIVALPLMAVLFGIKATDRVKNFLFRFIAVPAKWIKTARQYKLNIYSNKPYNLIWEHG